MYFPLGQFVPEHHTLPGQKSHLMAPDHLGGIEFDLQLVWSAQSFDSPYQLWRATSSYSRYISLTKSNASQSRKIMEHHVTSNLCVVFVVLQERLLWGVHSIPHSLHSAANPGVDRLRGQASFLHSSCSREVCHHGAFPLINPRGHLNDFMCLVLMFCCAEMSLVRINVPKLVDCHQRSHF